MRILVNVSSSHLSAIQELALESDELTIASPFLAREIVSLLDSIIGPSSIKRIALITGLQSFEQALSKPAILFNFVDYCEKNRLMWRVLIDEDLHSKVYVFSKAGKAMSAVITSANFTSYGLQKNHETGVVLTDAEALSSLKKGLQKDAVKVSKADIIKFQNGANEYKRKHKIPVNSKINFNPWLLLDTPQEEQPAYIERQYFFKPCGWRDKPFLKPQVLGDEMYFARRGKPKVHRGDILICYGVGSKALLGYYEITSDEVFYTNDEDRWPYYVYSRCLTPKYSNTWWDKTLTFEEVNTEYRTQYPDAAVTYAGGYNVIGGMQNGNDKIRLNTEYADFLMSRIAMQEA